MFKRTIDRQLSEWANLPNRKPLILRGARQVGKTTAVKLFSNQFEQFIRLDLDMLEDRQIFEKEKSFNDLLSAIFFYKKAKPISLKTLIFIDEIQNSPFALKMLKYFYEEMPELYVIAAGSLLETILATGKDISIPVGRVEYLIMRPASFYEFLIAINEDNSAEILNRIPIPKYAHDKLLKLFHTYALIGGMPEVIKQYSLTKDINALEKIYDSLLVSYISDIEKYAKHEGIARVVRSIIRNVFKDAGNRVKLDGYGNSGYKYREINEAFNILEKALLLTRVWPTTDVTIPYKSVYNKAPKLQLLDTGLVNHFAGLKHDIFSTDDISSVYKGKIAEHIIGQELLSLSSSVLFNLNFWVREKPQSSAEVDFIYNYNGLVIPIEVKSGATGSLKSLHQFIDAAPHNFAVRFYNGELLVNKGITVAGKEFLLLNMPFYLAGKLMEYLEWFINKH